MTFLLLMHKLRTCTATKDGDRFAFVERATQ